MRSRFPFPDGSPMDLGFSLRVNLVSIYINIKIFGHSALYDINLRVCFIQCSIHHFWISFRFVLSAISPAVVVPSLLSLAERGFGLDKGIPTLVIAAASIDDVVAISGFGICLGIAFSTGKMETCVTIHLI